VFPEASTANLNAFSFPLPPPEDAHIGVPAAAYLATKTSVDVVLPVFVKVDVPMLYDPLEKVPPI
jgi:hypothetical protein